MKLLKIISEIKQVNDPLRMKAMNLRLGDKVSFIYDQNHDEKYLDKDGILGRDGTTDILGNPNPIEDISGKITILTNYLE